MYKCVYAVPKWLISVPAGEYSIRQLRDLTGASHHNIYQRLSVLEVEKEFKKINNFWMCIYKWQGAAYYLREVHRRSIELIDKEEEGNTINDN